MSLNPAYTTTDTTDPIGRESGRWSTGPVLLQNGVDFLWKEDSLRFSNPGSFRVGIKDAYVGGNSDPRNETTMKMFTLINIGERAGGGISDMIKKWTSAGFGRPVLSERVNPERSSIFLQLEKEGGSNISSFIPSKSEGINGGMVVGDNERVAFRLAIEQGRVTTAMLSENAGISKLTANRTLKHLADMEVLTWRGRNKTDPSQYYELSEN